MIGSILQFQDLQRLCRPAPSAPLPKLATVERWARDQGIRYRYDGQGGIWTTLEALNAALGIVPSNEEPLSPQDVFG
jgi:hypothetical protein